MSRPELPESSLGGGKSETARLFELAGLAVVAWELGWLVFLLSGNGPEGQIWSVLGRWVTLWRRLALGQSYPGGWMKAEWGVAHPIALGPVLVVSVVVVLVVVVAVYLMDRGLPSRGPRRDRSQGSGFGGGGRPQQPVAGQRNTTLKEFLEKQEHGEN